MWGEGGGERGCGVGVVGVGGGGVCGAGEVGERGGGRGDGAGRDCGSRRRLLLVLLLVLLLAGAELLLLVLHCLVVVLLEHASQHSKHLHVTKPGKVTKTGRRENKRDETKLTARLKERREITPAETVPQALQLDDVCILKVPVRKTHSDLMRFRPKGCLGQGMVAGMEGGWSPISAMRAAVDQACTRSFLPCWAATKAFLLHTSPMSDPDTLQWGRGMRWEPVYHII